VEGREGLALPVPPILSLILQSDSSSSVSIKSVDAARSSNLASPSPASSMSTSCLGDLCNDFTGVNVNEKSTYEILLTACGSFVPSTNYLVQ
jgi:hypothetical protein